MNAPIWILLAAIAWIVWAAVSRVLKPGPRGDAESAFAMSAVRLYARFFHRLRVQGTENIPTGERPGPLIIVANHSAGVDPALIQAACPFEVTWMMAADMMTPWGERAWKWLGVIPVDRDGGDSRAAREALRVLRAGGVIGVFPESGIARPRGTVLPFAPGVGLLAHKGGRLKGTSAPVLLAIIDGTPDAATAFGSLLRRSRSVVRFLPVVEYPAKDWGAAELAGDLRRRVIEATGWRANDRPDKSLVRA